MIRKVILLLVLAAASSGAVQWDLKEVGVQVIWSAVVHGADVIREEIGEHGPVPVCG